jgi:hypothetical protein
MTKMHTALSVPDAATLARRQSDDPGRRQSLRRLDDILETLEQLNLHDRTELTDHAAEHLVMLGIREPHSIPIPQLIERVWAMQLPYLITIQVERRRRRRRVMDPTFGSAGRLVANPDAGEARNRRQVPPFSWGGDPLNR